MSRLLLPNYWSAVCLLGNENCTAIESGNFGEACFERTADFSGGGAVLRGYLDQGPCHYGKTVVVTTMKSHLFSKTVGFIENLY
jgi:hypothetical protein